MSSSYDVMISSFMNVSIFITIMGKVHLNSKFGVAAAADAAEPSQGAHSAPSGMDPAATVDGVASHADFAARRSLPGEPSAQWWPCVSVAFVGPTPLADESDGVAVVVPESGGGIDRRLSFFLPPDGSTCSGFDAAQPIWVCCRLKRR